MFIVGILSWWYGAGLLTRILIVRNMIESIIDYFSINLLFRTIFSPFKQISASSVSGSVGVMLHAFFDRLFSRCVGAVVRLTLIIVGIAGISIVAILGVIIIFLWMVVPVAPIIGIILNLIDWMPSWM
jgi:hypothetical protein